MTWNSWKAGAEADDTIYITEQILGKFYPSREKKFEAKNENTIKELLKKLSGRRYYEEIENNRIQKENEIFNRHVTISERIEKILKIKKSITKPVFDIKQILKKSSEAWWFIKNDISNANIWCPQFHILWSIRYNLYRISHT